MFDTSHDLLDLTVAERGLGVGHALPAYALPLCCSIVLCVGCSSSSCSIPPGGGGTSKPV